jgi:hypothetical protein
MEKGSSLIRHTSRVLQKIWSTVAKERERGRARTEKNFIVTTGGGLCPDEMILSANVLLPFRACFPG